MNAALAAQVQQTQPVHTARKPLVLRPGERSRRRDTDDTRSFANEAGERFWYRLDAEGRALLTGYSSELAEVVLPESLEGHELVSLETGAFADLSGIKHLTCPETLRRIGDYAFSRCAQLRTVELNEGLESLGHAAFYLCSALESLQAPSTLAQVASRPFGDAVYGRKGRAVARLEVPAGHEHLLVDAEGALYQRVSDGWRLVDGSAVAGPEFEPFPGTVELGESAFLGNLGLRAFHGNAGLKCIARDAFRGCAHLSHVELPETLECICTCAFSRATVRHLRIPASCVSLEEDALCTGPVFKGSAGRPYSSDLASIEVEHDNPRYFSRGGALFEHGNAGGTERLVLCPKTLAELDLTRTEGIDSGALAGTEHIGSLTVHEGLAGYGCTHFSCEWLRVVPDPTRVGAGAAPVAAPELELELPGGKVGAALMTRLFAPAGIELAGFLAAFDEALLEMLKRDKIEASRLMVHRCASPLLLSERHAQLFRDFLSANIASVAAHFGARGYWQGLDLLDKTGLLNAGNVSSVANVLARCCGSLAVGHVLELENARHGTGPQVSLEARIEDAYAL